MKFMFTKEDVQGSLYIPFEGKFLVRIVGQESKNSNAGNKVLHLDLRGLKAHDKLEGREVITVTEKMMWKMAALFKAAGMKEEDLLSGKADPTWLVGRVVVLLRLNAHKEMYNGKELTRFDSKFIKPTDEEMSGIEVGESTESTSTPDFGVDGDIPF